MMIIFNFYFYKIFNTDLAVQRIEKGHNSDLITMVIAMQIIMTIFITVI